MIRVFVGTEARLRRVELSIRAHLAAENSKAYLRTLANDGFEMGVGRAGVYAAHAHRGFTDVAFAPGGMTIHAESGPQVGLLHFTNPGCWFGPIEFHSDFWFAEFFQSEGDRCAVPDKITDRSEVGRVGCSVFTQFQGTVPTVLGRNLEIRIDGQRLQVMGLDSGDSELVVAL